MIEKDKRLRLYLKGPFRIESCRGEIYIESAKCIGLLALLASTDNFCRTRIWLQDKLWSNRGKEQGAASLRQALSTLKRKFQDYPGALIIDRRSVRLCPDFVEIVDLGPGDGSQDFLEGLDVRDPEFEQWLRLERVRQSPSSLTHKPTQKNGSAFSVHCTAENSGNRVEAFLSEVVVDHVSRCCAELAGIEIHQTPPNPESQPCLLVKVRCFVSENGECNILVSVQQLPEEKQVWFCHRTAKIESVASFDDLGLLELVFQTSEAIADGAIKSSQYLRDKVGAGLSAHLAVRKLFTMNANEIEDADALLSAAFDEHRSASYLGWKVQLRVIKLLEQISDDRQVLKEESEELIARAMSLSPTNSVSLAAASNASTFLRDDVENGIELARKSLKANPSNPLAWDCLSIAFLMNGEHELAHRYQLVARRLTDSSPVGHFWDMGVCLTSLALGETSSAKKFARKANLAAPEFRPPLRYMVALSAMDGDFEGAQSYVQKLTSLEKDFSVRRMVEDLDYPVAAMRQAGLLDGHELRSLINT